MSKCKVYKAFNDYFMDCKPKPEDAPEKKPAKADSSDKKNAYVPPAEVDFSKYGFSKYQ